MRVLSLVSTGEVASGGIRAFGREVGTLPGPVGAISSPAESLLDLGGLVNTAVGINGPGSVGVAEVVVIPVVGRSVPVCGIEKPPE